MTTVSDARNSPPSSREPAVSTWAIPAYDRALRDFMSTVMEGLVGADPLFADMGKRSTGHAGPVRNVTGQLPVDHQPTPIREAFSVHRDVIRNTDVEAFVIALAELAARYLDALGPVFLQSMRDVTDATGNAIDAGGRPLTWDLLLDGLEQIEVAFDEDGSARPLQVLLNPNTAKLLLTQDRTPEHQQRYDAIMQRKKEQWDAQKRTRRLPRSRERTGI